MMQQRDTKALQNKMTWTIAGCTDLWCCRSMVHHHSCIHSGRIGPLCSQTLSQWCSSVPHMSPAHNTYIKQKHVTLGARQLQITFHSIHNAFKACGSGTGMQCLALLYTLTKTGSSRSISSSAVKLGQSELTSLVLSLYVVSSASS